MFRAVRACGSTARCCVPASLGCPSASLIADPECDTDREHDDEQRSDQRPEQRIPSIIEVLLDVDGWFLAGTGWLPHGDVHADVIGVDVIHAAVLRVERPYGEGHAALNVN